MNSARYVSRLTRQTQALILAGGRGTRLEMLTNWRAKPAVPFGGQFRIIDFSLSNCLHSDIRRIAVLTQYKSHSLIRHLMVGWKKLNTDYGSILDIIPAQQWLEDDSWYQGTADAVFQSLDIIEAYDHDYTLILAGDHIYKMDYGEMLAEHVRSGADMTVACNLVPLDSASSFGVMKVDEQDWIAGFQEKPEQPQPIPGDPQHALVSMGIYIFNSEFLHEALSRDAEQSDSSHDFGKDIIPASIAAGRRLLAFPLQRAVTGKPYWRDVGTLDALYQANMELLGDDPPLDVHQPYWPIFTYPVQGPPAKFTDHGPRGGCTVVESMVGNGCVISDSSIRRSLIFNDCRIDADCELDGVLVHPNCHIGAGSRLKNVLLDNGCIVPPGTVIGEDPAADARRFHVTEGGIVVVNREMLGQERRYQPPDYTHIPRSPD
ncbi:MAG: glucose-1-phosphate adenylyltransferase [Wenzhouxiangella sp.]|jgi:glucose-1-phosphate adenylyltransferase|nr:glucose-1-phosphate adenylyltransferase [Wenzhouxiangella sp.]